MNDKCRQIEEHRKKIAELEREIEEERRRRLAEIHKELGFENRAQLISALRQLSDNNGRRGRRKITPELKKKIQQALRSGKPGASVSREFEISMPTVQNIKKELGLVRSK